MDHYTVLGISRNATKDEIKKAYRKLAMQFHPDKHAHSPNNLKEAATSKFKLISQAYDTLIDDRTRSTYNQTHHNTNHNTNYSRTSDYSRKGSYNYGYGYSGAGQKRRGFGVRRDQFFSFLNSKAFLRNVTLVGVLMAGSVVISSGGHTLWEMQNSGKSFEDAMESIEKAKKLKDKA